MFLINPCPVKSILLTKGGLESSSKCQTIRPTARMMWNESWSGHQTSSHSYLLYIKWIRLFFFIVWAIVNALTLVLHCSCLLQPPPFTIHLWSSYKTVNGGLESNHTLCPLTALSCTDPVIMIDTGLRHILLCEPILTVLHHRAWLNALKALICLNYNMALDLSPVCWRLGCVHVSEAEALKTPLHIISPGSPLPVICPAIISVPSIQPIKGV